MLLSRVHYPVRNLGYGVRAGIWFQGCTVYCQGCISRDTWSFDPSRECPVDAVLDWVDDIDGPVDGITISGGEPTDQSQALRALLNGMAARRSDIDILMYSGRTVDVLQAEMPWLWHAVDVLISEPYDAGSAGPCALRGSANQRVHRLSELAWRRYPDDDLEMMYGAQRQQLSVHVDDNTVWLVGIPKPGDLVQMRKALEGRGLVIGRTSWLS